MTWRERLYLTLAISASVAPLALIVYLLVQRKRHLLVTGGRYRAAMTGLVLALIAALPSPLFYFDLELPIPVKAAWLPVLAGGLPIGLVCGLMAIPLLAFARGRVRWMGIASTVLCVTLLYLTLLGLSD